MNESAIRRVKFWTPEISWRKDGDGSIKVWRDDPLGSYPDKMNEKLLHWAAVAPDRVWMAERDGDGWRRVTYHDAVDSVRRIGQSLLDMGLSVERPLVILAENSVTHGLLALGAQHVGIPSAAVSPSYAAFAGQFEKLREIAEQVTPGLVFVEDGNRFMDAVDHAFGQDMPVVVLRNPPSGRANTYVFADFLEAVATASVDEAFAATGPDTIAKFLFTSGTTGSPKAVIQTQRMLCSNQEMIADCYAFLRDEPPVIVNWSPWNHTAGGNKLFNNAIYNGGTYYVDHGKPSPQMIGKTIANLREISPTWYFNVPAGYEMLVQAMRNDVALRESFFGNMKLMMYAGAGMAQHTWDALNVLAEQTIGTRVPLGTGLGATETGPFSLYCTDPQEQPGNIGIPAQGMEMKLVPFDEKYELRLKGPNITPGYWRSPELTAKAFDEEGFYQIGDAVRFAKLDDPSHGFYFDGRTAENFKLQTGTWVSVGKLRATLVDDFGGLIRDAVITGENRGELGALVIASMPPLRELVGAANTDMTDDDILAHPLVRDALAAALQRHQRRATGSATRVARLVVIRDAPRLDKGEITDKGSLNQRAMLSLRKDLVEQLYLGSPDVITVGKDMAA